MTVGAPGALVLPPTTEITIAGTHTISVLDGPDQWLTATADTVLSMAVPTLSMCWRLTVVIDPAIHTVTLPSSASPVPVRWDSGLVPQPSGITAYLLDYIPTIGWCAHLQGGGIA